MKNNGTLFSDIFFYPSKIKRENKKTISQFINKYEFLIHFAHWRTKNIKKNKERPLRRQKKDSYMTSQTDFKEIKKSPYNFVKDISSLAFSGWIFNTVRDLVNFFYFLHIIYSFI